MFWAGSFFKRFVIAFILNFFILFLINLSLNSCTANTGHHLFSFNQRLPEVVCGPISRWASVARSINLNTSLSRSAFEQSESSWISDMLSADSSAVSAFGLDTLPLVFIEERTPARITKLFIYLLLPPLLLALVVEVLVSLRFSAIRS